MLKELVKIANDLDSRGLPKEADYLDVLIRKVAGETAQFVYTVQKGDQVGELALMALGDASRASEIYDVNADMLQGEALKAGTKINLPYLAERAGTLREAPNGKTLQLPDSYSASEPTPSEPTPSGSPWDTVPTADSSTGLQSSKDIAWLSEMGPASAVEAFGDYADEAMKYADFVLDNYFHPDWAGSDAYTRAMGGTGFDSGNISAGSGWMQLEYRENCPHRVSLSGGGCIATEGVNKGERIDSREVLDKYRLSFPIPLGLVLPVPADTTEGASAQILDPTYVTPAFSGQVKEDNIDYSDEYGSGGVLQYEEEKMSWEEV